MDCGVFIRSGSSEYHVHTGNIQYWLFFKQKTNKKIILNSVCRLKYLFLFSLYPFKNYIPYSTRPFEHRINTDVCIFGFVAAYFGVFRFEKMRKQKKKWEETWTHKELTISLAIVGLFVVTHTLSFYLPNDICACIQYIHNGERQMKCEREEKKYNKGKDHSRKMG